MKNVKDQSSLWIVAIVKELVNMYHYFVSYIIKFKNNSIGYGNTEITQGYPIDEIEDIKNIMRILGIDNLSTIPAIFMYSSPTSCP